MILSSNGVWEADILKYWNKQVCKVAPGFTGGVVEKNSPASAGNIEHSFDPCVELPGGELDNPTQYSCLEKSQGEEPGELQSLRSRSDMTEVT